MRTSVAAALALVLALPPRVSHGGEWSPEQQATVQKVIDLSNRGALDDAVALAQQEFARASSNKGYRRALAREGKAAALKLYERDQATPQAESAVAALCVAVDLMRAYQAELIESDQDRARIPPELTRLEALATTAKAPCAPPAPVASPSPPVQVAAVDQQVEARSQGPAGEPARLPVPPAARRSRVQVGVGAGLVTVGVGLLAVMTAAFVARRSDDARIAAVGARAVAEDRPLTAGENADVAVWDARYVRLENTGKVLGTLAGLSILAGVLVLVMTPKRRGPQARLRSLGTGVLVSF